VRKAQVYLWFLLSFITQSVFGQADLTCAPMHGYTEMREASIWIQTTESAEVLLVFWPDKHKESERRITRRTLEAFAFSEVFVCTNLEPGTTYRYEVAVNGVVKNKGNSFYTQPLWQYRTDPPEFKIAMGSCAFINDEQYDRPGEPYGKDYGIFDEIAAKEPNAMLWLGDNVYFREVDWNTKSGMIYRYNQMRKLPELQKLLSACAHYAIWDDHDFGPNDSNGSFIHKDWSLEVFKTFWANNSYGVPGLEGGITGQFTLGDMDFFMLDNRYFRTEADIKGIEPTILGKEQMDWLIQALEYSKAPFKFVAIGGQVLNTAQLYENYSQYPSERDTLLSRIDRNHIEGVVFLTGDRHCTEFSSDTLTGGTIVYDLTVSPLTSKSYDNTQEKNENRIQNTIVPVQNFATIDFKGKRKERKMLITIFDSEGKKKWEQEIAEKAIK
jgi:alkaline phosphatase D